MESEALRYRSGLAPAFFVAGFGCPISGVIRPNWPVTMTTDAKLHALLEPGAQALGFEILAVEMLGRGSGGTLRVYIDAPEGVTVDDCAAVSRQLSAILDVEDPIAEQYTLEVSSPGVDRPLSKPQHFAAAIGEQVKLQAHALLAGRKRFKGTLTQARGDAIVMEVDGVEYEIAYADIAKARLAPDYDALLREL